MRTGLRRFYGTGIATTRAGKLPIPRADVLEASRQIHGTTRKYHEQENVRVESHERVIRR
jgi:hypothetical protein